MSERAVVLDASALLALLGQETGAEEVSEALPHAVVGAVNLSEVVGKLAERGMPEAAIRSALDGLALAVHPFDAELAYATGMLRATTASLGLSLGDRACLALGRMLSLPILTADRSWKKLAIGVKIQVIR